MVQIYSCKSGVKSCLLHTPFFSVSASPLIMFKLNFGTLIAIMSFGQSLTITIDYPLFCEIDFGMYGIKERNNYD